MADIAWSTLPTYTDGSALTAAQLLAIAANINETAPAKATTARSYFVATGTNTIAERTFHHDEVLTTGTTTSAAYANPTGDNGPDIDIVTGTAAMFFHALQLENSGAGSTWGSFGITGATTTAISDQWAVMTQTGASNGNRAGVSTWLAMTAGTSNANMQYRVSSGTGSFDDRRIACMGL